MNSLKQTEINVMLMAVSKTAMVELKAETELPTSWGSFVFSVFKDHTQPTKDVVVLSKKLRVAKADPRAQRLNLNNMAHDNVHVRVHDQCITSEVFGSVKCDCKHQLISALKHIQVSGGAVIYLPQEGRGIGLANKIRAYAAQTYLGLDTVDANIHIGCPVEARTYTCVPDILRSFRIRSVLLMTNNPFKVESLRDLGVVVAGTISAQSAPPSALAAAYLDTKRDKMDHALPPSIIAVDFDDELEHDDAYDLPRSRSPPPPPPPLSSSSTPSTSPSLSPSSPLLPPSSLPASLHMLDTNLDANLLEMLVSLNRSIVVRKQHASLQTVSTTSVSSSSSSSPSSSPSSFSTSSRSTVGFTPTPSTMTTAALPFLTIAYTQYLDGSMGSTTHAHHHAHMHSKQNKQAIALRHNLGVLHDANLIDITTALHEDFDECYANTHAHGCRVMCVVDPHLRLPTTSALVQRCHETNQSVLLLCCADEAYHDYEHSSRLKALQATGVVKLVPSRFDVNTVIHLGSALTMLTRHHNISSVLMEAGDVSLIHQTVQQHVVRKLVDNVIVFLSTQIAPEQTQKLSFSLGSNVKTFVLGSDVVLQSQQLVCSPKSKL